MTIIYITRHGETKWNKESRFQGNLNSDLTEKGIMGAELLSFRMENIELDYIIASPLKRAYETAEVIRGNKNIEIIADDGLKEINLGDFEGMTLKEIQSIYNEQFIQLQEDPFNNSYPNGESLIEFYDRVVNSFKGIIEKYKGKKILIVAHGGTVKCIECYYHNKKINKDWMMGVVKNCSLTCIEVDDNNKIKEIYYNSTEHLEDKVEYNN